MNNVAKKLNILKIVTILCIIFIVISFEKLYAAPYTLCKGSEFNQRVKLFLNGNDLHSRIENTIRGFQRGYNPPDDPNYYVDVSEDRDGSIIAYITDYDINSQNSKVGNSVDSNYILYWYSDGVANMNQDAAYMFDKFVRIRNIDLSGFSYLKGLTDTRYMFLDCRNLRNLKFKEDKNGKPFYLAEMQGMFYSCQSLLNVDLTLFDTKMVDNMDEVFCKCYNLRNIYVDTSRWNIENVRSFKKMFSECHSLRTNTGIKAVDIANDDYEKYAIAGGDNANGFMKDTDYTYSDYGEYLGTVPIDGANYIDSVPQTTQPYADEPEDSDETGSGIGEGIPYVGNSASGYNSEKPQIIEPSVIVSNANQDGPNESSTSSNLESETSIVETSNVVVIVETTLEESSSDDVSENEVDSNRQMIEIDEYLKEKEGKGDILSGIFENYKFLLLALSISVIVILLLVGMVIFLTKSNRENKFDDTNEI